MPDQRLTMHPNPATVAARASAAALTATLGLAAAAWVVAVRQGPPGGEHDRETGPSRPARWRFQPSSAAARSRAARQEPASGQTMDTQGGRRV
jgi:hypothetical protein